MLNKCVVIVFNKLLKQCSFNCPVHEYDEDTQIGYIDHTTIQMTHCVFKINTLVE